MAASRNDKIKLYFDCGLPYKQILFVLAHRDGVIISERHLRRILKSLGLTRRNRYSEINQVIQFIHNELLTSGMLHGYRWMFSKCRQAGIKAKKEEVRIILSHLDPTGVTFRKSRRLHRRLYFSQGPNFIWHIDSYDKLKYFGICINGCIDGFSRKLVWLNSYTTSSNPSVIAGYYFEAVEEIESCPHLVRTDFGTENVRVKLIQQLLRRNDTDPNAGEKSYMASTYNQRIEQWWGNLRKECIEFWLVLFHDLKDNGNFDGEYLDKNILQFCFMAIIQDELDTVMDVWNNHWIRPSRNLQVPTGQPNIMYSLPEVYGTQDKGHPLDLEEIEQCKDVCTFRNSIPCADENIFDVCVYLMTENNLELPIDSFAGIKLYLFLIQQILQRI